MLTPFVVQELSDIDDMMDWCHQKRNNSGNSLFKIKKNVKVGR